MKQALQTLLNGTRWSCFHVCMFGLTMTGLMLAFSAGDLGPFAPLLVAEGIALVFFSACCEFVFFARLLLHLVLKNKTEVKTDKEKPAG